MKPLAIYIHVPFCARKCVYCDFASYAGREAAWEQYFEALHGEIDAWGEELRTREVRSVFFGGGTPSLVPAEPICGALERLRSHAILAPDCEITMEANPGTISREKLRACRAAGVNRISIGVQSFDGELLCQLGRIHSPEEAAEAVLLARESGFDNISVDLMYALPGQSMAQWKASLERAAELPVKHISAYSLIVEEGTEMLRRVQAGEALLPDEDMVNEMQRMAVDFLARRGFARYEISNYAQPGFESRHNIIYWELGEYLGLGCAAHSLMNDERFANPPELERYLAGERMLDRQRRSLRDRQEERIMLETRMTRGLNLAAWRRDFGADFSEGRAGALRKLENYGLIELENGFLRLTTAGLELQDSVVLELLED